MSLTQEAPVVAPPTPARRRLILAICCMSLFIVGIDLLGVNVALPSISSDLGATATQLQWVVDAYTLVLASLLMLSGSVADRIGRRRVFQTGLFAFGLGSVLCSVAQSPGMLIGARMVQAVGGSMLNPVAMSIITDTFRDARDRARAIGVWSGVVGLSMALGPVVGGTVVDAVGWRAIFWLNVPVVVAALVLTALFVPESRSSRPRRPDPAAQVLVVLMLATLTYGIIEGRALGWTSLPVLSLAAVAALSSAALVVVERRRSEPLLDPRFFRSIPFTGSVAAAVVGFCSMGGFLFVNTLYLQQVRGFTPLQAGLMTLPMAGATALVGPIAGRVVGSRGPRPPMVVAGVAISASAVLLLRLDTQTPIAYLAVAYLLFGVGFGSLNAPITNAAVSGMPVGQAGVAASIASTSRQVGSSLGVAIIPAVTFAAMAGPVRTSLAQASHTGWAVMLGCGLVLVALAFVVTAQWALASRARIAHELDAD